MENTCQENDLAVVPLPLFENKNVVFLALAQQLLSEGGKKSCLPVPLPPLGELGPTHNQVRASGRPITLVAIGWRCTPAAATTGAATAASALALALALAFAHAAPGAGASALASALASASAAALEGAPAPAPAFAPAVTAAAAAVPGITAIAPAAPAVAATAPSAPVSAVTAAATATTPVPGVGPGPPGAAGARAPTRLLSDRQASPHKLCVIQLADGIFHVISGQKLRNSLAWPGDVHEPRFCHLPEEPLEVLPVGLARQTGYSYSVLGPDGGSPEAGGAPAPAPAPLPPGGELHSHVVPVQHLPIHLIHSVSGITGVIKFNEGKPWWAPGHPNVS
eukprot:CAMPEP_0113935538 /NCGR_PEP_ID=MMETSP1339-20121228/2683_1 /TAXON_ID=94617 /ORGANISM="Fibrocapsa japonica" /LENGTH=336 /DNA_ID=CAMNT_0000937739 /DNA_START=39 /DNA_END=1050 /DNA_ORIENTATION=- /assembly_acc=CAM_ASM_000762